MSFFNKIEKLKKLNIQTYRADNDRFIAEYNHEIELAGEYNGRQLLELLQNADDALSDAVEIKIEKNNNSLIVSNKGESFTVEGVKSLMLANLSPKTKKSYIGNKGLGFRSILNWADMIRIYTNGCEISFSHKIAERTFSEIVTVDQDRKRLQKERGLKDQTIPFPLLAIPDIREVREEQPRGWSSTIEIIYKKGFEKDIVSQIDEIKEEILLFLNHINKITICINNAELKSFTRTRKIDNEFDSIRIEDKQWTVVSKEARLPDELQNKNKDEEQSYSLKVAYQRDLSDRFYKLFNFFPTQLNIHLPCIIHGTFELSSSRNYLNNSKINEFILKELVILLADCALFLTKEEIVDWRPYKLLTPLVKTSDSELIEAFYEDLDKVKEIETIYPCINNKYQPLKNVAYYDDEFDLFFMKHFRGTLPNLLIPLNNEVENKLRQEYKYEDLVEKIDQLSQTDISMHLRVELIAQLIKVPKNNTENLKFSLLVNKSKEVIDKTIVAFTPVIRAEEKLEIPGLVDVDFINYELYNLLCKRFENEFAKEEKNKNRELQRIIKSVVNLQPYDSNNVIDKIITGTKDALKTISSEEEKITRIKEMVVALYANFKNIESRQEKLKLSVPLISKANKISNAEDLFLSGTYPSGKLTEVIYEKSIKEDQYLAEIELWDLTDIDLDSIEMFFLWLGVNKYSKITSINLQNTREENDYFDFIFDNGTNKPDNFEIGRIQSGSIVSKIERFDEIQRLPVNKIILLTLKDALIRKLLEVNDEKITWTYVTWRPPIIADYSYLRYQFLKSNIFTKYTLQESGEDLNKLINEDFQIDYEFLAQFGINKAEVKSILVKLGAKESFNDISPKNVYEILKAIPGKDVTKKGKATQSIYKMALESLVKQESTFPVPDDILYFARKAEIEGYRPLSEVYYSDNSILPKKILNTLFILNLKKRIGEDNVVTYFGVKSLREFKIGINEQKLEYNPCDDELNRLFESLKPYILANRIKSITNDDTKKQEARILKQCRIHIVTQCFFKFGENEEIPIEEKEFINEKDIFYFKESSLSSVDRLKNDSLFCDAFAEMMCIIFKVNDLKNDFRQILRNDLHDTSHLANLDLDKGKVEEAFQLLGISREEIKFWKNVFSLMNTQLIEPVENAEVLRQKVKSALCLTLPESYANVNFETFDNKEFYELICLLCNANDLELTLEQVLPSGLSNWHKKKFVDNINDYKYKFTQIAWESLKSEQNKQRTFLSMLDDYDTTFINHIKNDIQDHKFDLKVDYLSITKELIEKHFLIDVNVSISDNTQIKNLYEALLRKYNVEEGDITEESTRSLLFFEGNKEVIETYLKGQFGSSEEEENGSKSDDAPKTGLLVAATLSKNEIIIQVNLGKAKGAWVHTDLSDKGKKRKGKKTELLVYNTLVEKYGIENVKWVSGNSTTPDKNDKLHYDIEYKNETGEWKYLEVKAVSDNKFIISAPEKEKGMSKPDMFEMALVSDTTIYMVKDMFKFKQGETFESNSKFVACAKDYVFSFNISSAIACTAEEKGDN